MMDGPSGGSGNAFCTVKEFPFTFISKMELYEFLG